MRWGFEGFERKQLLSEGASVGSARVQGGDASIIELSTDRAVFINLPTDQIDAVRYKIVYDGPIRAPIAKGEAIARLEVSVPDMEPAIVPLLANNDIKSAGFFRRIYNGFAGWI
nr:hypothetical protein [Erythrobacter crassostrea]